MKHVIGIFAIVWTLTAQAQKKDGVHVGNGGGFSEYALQVAYRSYGDWLRYLQVNDKTVQGSEMGLLIRLVNEIEHEKGGLIFSHEQAAMIYSEPSVGSAIFINPSMLQQYTDEQRRDLSIHEALTLIINEMFRHILVKQDQSDTNNGISLKKKLDNLTRALVIATGATFQDVELIKSYSWSNSSNQDRLVLFSKQALAVDLEDHVYAESGCEPPSLTALKILEPSFLVSKQDNEGYKIQMNFYIKVTCGPSRYIKEVTARFLLKNKELKTLNVESRFLF